MTELNMNIGPEPVEDTPVVAPVDTPATEKETETVPAEDVTLVDGDKAGDEKDDKAASAQEVSPAVIAQKQEEARVFDESFPAFKGQNDVLPADFIARLWQNKALSQPTTTIPKEDEGPGRPTVVPLPLLDPDAAAKRLEEAITDGDIEARLAAVAEIAAFARGAAETVNSYGMQNEYDLRKMQTEIDELQLPATIRAAGAGMPGFQDSDVTAALALLESGQVSDPALAVGYAVNARLVASNSTAPPSAAEIAARKGDALTAASAPESETASPAPKFTGAERMDSPDMKAAMLADYRAQEAARSAARKK